MTSSACNPQSERKMESADNEADQDFADSQRVTFTLEFMPYHEAESMGAGGVVC